MITPAFCLLTWTVQSPPLDSQWRSYPLLALLWVKASQLRATCYTRNQHLKDPVTFRWRVDCFLSVPTPVTHYFPRHPSQLASLSTYTPTRRSRIVSTPTWWDSEEGRTDPCREVAAMRLGRVEQSERLTLGWALSPTIKHFYVRLGCLISRLDGNFWANPYITEIYIKWKRPGPRRWSRWQDRRTVEFS